MKKFRQSIVKTYMSKTISGLLQKIINISKEV